MCLVVAGCAPVIHRVPETVKVPVPVPCLKLADIPTPKEPFLSDEQLLALDRYKRTLKVMEERIEYQGYTAKLVAVLTACAGG